MQQKTKTNMCVSCGEEKAQVRIPNPNGAICGPPWDVCVTCQRIIEQQKRLSLGFLLIDTGNEGPKKIGRTMMEEAQKEIDYLSKESGKEVFSTVVKIKRNVDLIKVKDVVLNKGNHVKLPQSNRKERSLPTQDTRKRGLIPRLVTVMRGFW